VSRRQNAPGARTLAVGAVQTLRRHDIARRVAQGLPAVGEGRAIGLGGGRAGSFSFLGLDFDCLPRRRGHQRYARSLLPYPERRRLSRGEAGGWSWGYRHGRVT
jgi:hypothetical protein